MPKFRKKPVVISAWQWDETHTTLNVLKAEGLIAAGHNGHVNRPNECRDLRIHTLEGAMRADHGDWIIKGVKGEFYPCKPDIFAATYESAEEPNR